MCLARVDAPEVAVEACARQLGDLPGDLDTRRSASHDDEGHPGTAGFGVILGLGHLEGPEDAATQLEGVVDRLHSWCEARELVVTEVGLPCSGGDDQAVERMRASRVVGTGRGHRPLRQVKMGHGRELDLDVVVLAQDPADRGRDLSLGEDSGRELVQQRLEQVIVDAVDQGHLHRSPLEEPCGEEAAEATAHNDHAMSCFCGHWDLLSLLPGQGMALTASRPADLRGDGGEAGQRAT